MAVTALINAESYLDNQPLGTKKVSYGTIAGPASYATGGFAADVATDLGITGTISDVFVTADKGTTAEWVTADKKIKAYKSFETEADNTDNLSTHTFLLTIVYYD